MKNPDLVMELNAVRQRVSMSHKDRTKLLIAEIDELSINRMDLPEDFNLLAIDIGVVMLHHGIDKDNLRGLVDLLSVEFPDLGVLKERERATAIRSAFLWIGVAHANLAYELKPGVLGRKGKKGWYIDLRCDS